MQDLPFLYSSYPIEEKKLNPFLATSSQRKIAKQFGFSKKTKDFPSAPSEEIKIVQSKDSLKVPIEKTKVLSKKLCKSIPNYKRKFFLPFWTASHRLETVGRLDYLKEVPVYKKIKDLAISSGNTMADIRLHIDSNALKHYGKIKYLKERIIVEEKDIEQQKKIMLDFIQKAKTNKDIIKLKKANVKKMKQEFEKELKKDPNKFASTYFVKELPEYINRFIITKADLIKLKVVEEQTDQGSPKDRKCYIR